MWTSRSNFPSANMERWTAGLDAGGAAWMGCPFGEREGAPPTPRVLTRGPGHAGDPRPTPSRPEGLPIDEPLESALGEAAARSGEPKTGPQIREIHLLLSTHFVELHPDSRLPHRQPLANVFPTWVDSSARGRGLVVST